MKDNRLFSKACSHAIFCYKRLYGYTHIDYFNQDKGLLINTTQTTQRLLFRLRRSTEHAQSKASVFVARKWGLHIETIGLYL